jgi:flagellar biosynthesis/type III secretory pathway protein FliH
MDDSEPDLYGGMGGYSDDEYTQTKWEGNGIHHTSNDENVVSMEYVPCIKFYTQEEMDKVIQASLNNARAAYEDGYEDGYDEGYTAGRIEGNENCQHR